MDPVAAVADLRSRFEPQQTEDYRRQLVVLSTFLVISLFVSVGSLALRYLANAFWLFRFNRGIIQAHSLCGWLVASSVFSMMAIPYLWINGSMGNQFIYRALLFVPLWCGVWSMAIATLVAPLSISRSQRPSKYALTSYPILINLLIIIFPLILFALVAWCTVLGNQAGDEMFKSYLALARAFSRTAIDMQEIGLASVKLQEDSTVMIMRWEQLWTVYACFIGIALALFSYSSIAYFHTLIVSMRTIREQQAQGSSAKLTSLGRAYASLITTTVVTALISTLYLVLASVLATKTGEISGSRALMDGVSLGAFWIFAICGGITNIAIFTRSIKLYRTHAFPTTTTTDSKVSTTNINLSRQAPRTVLPLYAGGVELNGMSGMPASQIIVTRDWEVKVDSEGHSSDEEVEKQEFGIARY